MRLTRKALALLTALALCLSLLPAAALAEGDDAPPASGHTHPICGKTCPHNGTHADSTTWIGLRQDGDKIYAGEEQLVSNIPFSYDLPAGNYYLEGDIDFDDNLIYIGLDEDKEVHLCLNGKELKANPRVPFTTSEFTVCDCQSGSGQGEGTLTADTISTNGRFALYGGTLEGNGPSEHLIDHQGGTVELAGGTIHPHIQSHYAVKWNNSAGTLILSGTTFEGSLKADILLAQGNSITVPKALTNTNIRVALNDPDWTREVVLAQGAGIDTNSAGKFTYVADGGRAANIEFRAADTTANKPARLVLTPTTYRVTFDPNGGTGEVPMVEKNLTESFSIPTEKPTREGYTLMGWSTDKDYGFNVKGWGQEKDGFYRADANPNNTYPSLNADTTLYAVWAKNVLDTNKDGAGNYPTLELAFENAADGGTIKVLESYTDPENAMLYEVASARSVTLDLNGCTVTAGDEVYLFNGENLTITGNGTYTGGLVQTPYGNLTIQNGTFGGLLIQGGAAELQSGTFQGAHLVDDQTTHAIVWTGADGASAKAALERLLAGKKLTGTDTEIYTEDGKGYGRACLVGPVTVSPPDTHTVTFETNGGSAVASVQVQNGGKVTRPADPVRAGWSFLGWYQDAALTTPWNFDADTVTGPITLYAGWAQAGSGGGDSSAPSYTVTLPGRTQGGDLTVRPTRAEKGDTVTITVEPDQGYELTALTVTDRNGEELHLTHKGDGRYTFTMPAGKVEIDAEFEKIDLRPDPLPFTDVDGDSWYGEAVRYVYENGLMSGTGADTFAPNAATSRAMVVAVLWRMAGSPQTDYLLTFDDVDPDSYYAEAVRWAASQGITSGYGHTFGPHDPVTREQFAAMLYRFADTYGRDTAQGGMALREFADYDAISPYAAQALNWAVGEGILSGTGANTLSPRGQATRAQVALMLCRFLEG